MNNYTEEEIAILVQRYDRKKEMEYKLYHEQKKIDPEFVKKNRARAKRHYDNTKPQQRINYQDNKEYYQARGSYYYYKKNDRMNTFIQKWPERVALLRERGYSIEKNPDPSIFVSNDSSSPEEQDSSVE
tara:strand:- start:848 stop:1234 length:387 start_codon:yes stop_codon:yes gene_type:complete